MSNFIFLDFTQQTLTKKIKLSDDQVVPTNVDDETLNTSEIGFSRNNNLPDDTIDVLLKHKDGGDSESKDNEEIICMRCDDKCNCQKIDPLHIDNLELEVKPDDDIREEMDTALDLTEIIEFKDEIIDDTGYNDKEPDITRYEEKGPDISPDMKVLLHVYIILLYICVLSILDLKYII